MCIYIRIYIILVIYTNKMKSLLATTTMIVVPQSHKYIV